MPDPSSRDHSEQVGGAGHNLNEATEYAAQANADFGFEGEPPTRDEVAEILVPIVPYDPSDASNQIIGDDDEGVSLN